MRGLEVARGLSFAIKGTAKDSLLKKKKNKWPWHWLWTDHYRDIPNKAAIAKWNAIKPCLLDRQREIFFQLIVKQKTVKETAVFFGISWQSVYAARKRGSIRIDKYFKFWASSEELERSGKVSKKVRQKKEAESDRMWQMCKSWRHGCKKCFADGGEKFDRCQAKGAGFDSILKWQVRTFSKAGLGDTRVAYKTLHIPCRMVVFQ